MELRIGNPCAPLVGVYIGVAIMEKSMKFLQKIKSRTAIWSSNSTSECLSKGNKITNLKRYLHPCVRCSIIYNSQDMETTEVSTDGWMG